MDEERDEVVRGLIAEIDDLHRRRDLLDVERDCLYGEVRKVYQKARSMGLRPLLRATLKERRKVPHGNVLGPEPIHPSHEMLSHLCASGTHCLLSTALRARDVR